MGFADFCCSAANYIGLAAGRGHNLLSSGAEKLKDSTKVLQPGYLSGKIRNAMLEKLTHALRSQAEFVMTKLTERMEIVDKVARPFYEKIVALSARGPVSETRLRQALDSIDGSDKLDEQEKVLMVKLFGQIVGCGTSKFVDAVVVEKKAQSPAGNKGSALTGSSEKT